MKSAPISHFGILASFELQQGDSGKHGSPYVHLRSTRIVEFDIPTDKPGGEASDHAESIFRQSYVPILMRLYAKRL
ncbi:MAG: hypothetical protein ACE361_19175 [Aureliella sp.]